MATSRGKRVWELQTSWLVPKSPVHLVLQTPRSHLIPASLALLHCGNYEMYILRFPRETGRVPEVSSTK
ncbi:hypothetical protein CapIbe_022533 [Capra ibex]